MNSKGIRELSALDQFWSPGKARAKNSRRSLSFHSDINNSMPFSSIAMSRDSAMKKYGIGGKKNSKFNFLTKLRTKKDKELLPGVEELKEETLEGLKQSERREHKRDFNEVFDTRASNPIHVNNLKFMEQDI